MKNVKKLLIVVMLVLTLFSAVGVNNVYAGGKNDDAIDDGKNTTGSNSVAKCADVEIPVQLTSIVSTVVTLIKVGVPIILVVLGMIDMGKAVASQKEDEIKKGQKILLSRCIAAGIVFFVVAIVQLLLNVISTSVGDNTDDKSSAWYCVCRLVGGDDNSCSNSGQQEKK